jgi:hypothetical protein
MEDEDTMQLLQTLADGLEEVKEAIEAGELTGEKALKLFPTLPQAAEAVRLVKERVEAAIAAAAEIDVTARQSKESATITVEPGKVEGTYVIALHILYPQNPDFIGNEVEVQCSIRDGVSCYEFNKANVPVTVNEAKQPQGEAA